MSYALDRYRILEAALVLHRHQHGTGSPEEEVILEEMTDLWWELTDEEREILSEEEPKRWPKETP